MQTNRIQSSRIPRYFFFVNNDLIQPNIASLCSVMIIDDIDNSKLDLTCTNLRRNPSTYIKERKLHNFKNII